MKRFFLLQLILAVFSIATFPQSYSDTVYVNPNSSTPEDGKTWASGWKDFTKFDIDSLYPSSVLLLVSPGTYTKGHNNYYYDSSRAILLINNKRDVKIKKFYYSPLGEEGEGGELEDVIFTPVDSVKYGIWLQPTRLVDTVKNITIEGIHFNNYKNIAIGISGFNFSNRVDKVLVRNCKFITNLGRRSIFIQRADSITIESCVINSAVTTNLENDGIYMQNVNNAVIKNNSITVSNSYSGTGQPHVDCIQVTRMETNNSSNILVENNTLVNSSQVDFFSDRQVIHMTYTSGYIKIWNNIIRSKKGDGLINIFYTEDTNELKIYNNTLYAEGDQRSILGIVYYPTGENLGYTPFYVTNNIFYKNSTPASSYVLLQFANVDTASINKNKLDHNLYFINSNPLDIFKTAFYDYYDTTYFYKYSVDWNYDDWEDEGKSGNPRFISSGDLRLQYSSAAKNIGKGLTEVKQDYYGNPRPYWNYDYDAGAFEIEDTQLKIGVTGLADSLEIIHTLTLLGNYWERSSEISWNLSSDQTLLSKTDTTMGNSDPDDLNSWDGWEYKWLDRNNSTEKRIAAGFYKLSNNLNDNYIYLDLRDAVSNHSLNIYIQFNKDINKYQYYRNNWNNDIDSASVLRIWQIHGGDPNTSGLGTSYWSNVLIPVEHPQHPRMIWGPVSGQSTYSVYHRQGVTFPWSHDTSLTNLYEYIDYSRFLLQPISTGSHIEDYIVLQNNDTSNIAGFEFPGDALDKAAAVGTISYNYNISQNYPNPFNPVTTINFSIANEDRVLIKVYDILGREVRTLIDKDIKPGEYQVEFSSGELASGVYIYRISSGNYSSVKKMQILK